MEDRGAVSQAGAADSALPSFAVVIPMFNEASGAERCVREVCGALGGLGNRSSLIVVEDGSRDGTGDTLRRLAPSEPALRVIFHEVNKGYGAALRTGTSAAAEAGFEYVLFMDSDLTNSPQDIRRFAAEMPRKTDVIKATRYSAGGGVSGVPFYRVVISSFGNWLARALFRLPLRDCTNGFRAVRTSLLVQMELEERKFPIIMEELWWCCFLAKTFAEVPVTLTNRDPGLRPTNFGYRPRVFVDYLKYPLKAVFGLRPPKMRRSEPSDRSLSKGTA